MSRVGIACWERARAVGGCVPACVVVVSLVTVKVGPAVVAHRCNVVTVVGLPGKKAYGMASRSGCGAGTI